MSGGSPENLFRFTRVPAKVRMDLGYPLEFARFLINHRVALVFYVEFFGDHFSATFSALTVEKHAWKIRGKFRRKNSAKKNRFSLLFSLCFSLFSSHPILRATFLPSNRKNFAQNPLCEKFPLRNCRFLSGVVVEHIRTVLASPETNRQSFHRNHCVLAPRSNHGLAVLSTIGAEIVAQGRKKRTLPPPKESLLATLLAPEKTFWTGDRYEKPCKKTWENISSTEFSPLSPLICRRRSLEQGGLRFFFRITESIRFVAAISICDGSCCKNESRICINGYGFSDEMRTNL